MAVVNTFRTAEGSAHILLDRVQTANFTGTPVEIGAANRVVEASVSGTGALTATVEIYGNTRNDNTTGVLLATVTLSGNNFANDGFAFDAPWPFVYARIPVGGLTGTGAAVTVDLAV